MIDVRHRRHHGPMSRIIASQFIGDQPSWLTTLAFELAAKEAFRGALIATTLHQNINRVAVLINRTPQILVFPLNGDKDFIQIPGIPQPPLSFFELPRILRPKLPAPLPNGLIGHRDAPCGQSFFDLTKAETESMGEPHGVANNFRGKPVTWVAGCFGSHAA